MATPNTLRFTGDGAGQNTFSRPAPDYVDARVLAAAVSEDQAVPTGARHVIFSATADFYAEKGGTAAVPAADVTNGTASELNPTIWSLDGVSTIGLIAPGATVITLTFYV
jgi:hypothetical protein